MSFTVYGAPISPFVRKVRVLLAEKGLDYTLDPVIPFNPPAEFRKLSPLGKIPAFRDGDKTLADSSIICTYIERRHPKPALYPTDDYNHCRALWFEEYADGGMMPVIGAGVFMPLVLNPVLRQVPPDHARAKKAVDEELPPLYDYLQGELGSQDYLVGNQYGIADISVVSTLVNLRHAGVQPDAKRWPKLTAYIERVLSRPTFKPLLEEEAKIIASMRPR